MALEKLFGGVLSRFVERTPITVMARAVIERVFEPAKLDRWFEKARERQYTRELLFSSVFELMSLVAFKVFPTVHAAYRVWLPSWTFSPGSDRTGCGSSA